MTYHWPHACMHAYVSGFGTTATCPCLFFFFNDTATTEIYTLSLHDALPISGALLHALQRRVVVQVQKHEAHGTGRARSEEHTSELQSPCNLVCRLLLEKKKKKKRQPTFSARSSRTSSARRLTPRLPDHDCRS